MRSHDKQECAIIWQAEIFDNMTCGHRTSWRYAVLSPVVPTIVTDAKDLPSGAYALDTWERVREEREEERKEKKRKGKRRKEKRREEEKEKNREEREEREETAQVFMLLGWLEVE